LSNATKHLRIFGRVQGVSFRAWVQKTAQHMGLSGWVRNRNDGSVEALIHGHSHEVDRFIAECYKGPTFAKVDTVSINEGVDEELRGFEIRETK
jgi:acylphosphatase